jgi:transcriptional regulator with XRE-family HTH domain
MANQKNEHPIRRLREARGFSLRVLERATGVSYVRIFYLERGVEATPRELERLARALACRPEDLQPPTVTEQEEA